MCYAGARLMRAEWLCCARTLKPMLTSMTNVVPPEAVTDAELETYLAGLPRNAQRDVQGMLASGAAESDISDYMARLRVASEGRDGLPEEDTTTGPSGFAAASPSRSQAASAAETKPRGKARGTNRAPARDFDRKRRTSGKLAAARYQGPPGVQGPNTGYWQQGGVTRVGAKRSKRP